MPLLRDFSQQRRTGSFTMKTGLPTTERKNPQHDAHGTSSGEPEDLLGTLLWLCSEGSEFVTGIVVPVDGGFSAYSGSVSCYMSVLHYVIICSELPAVLVAGSCQCSSLLRSLSRGRWQSHRPGACRLKSASGRFYLVRAALFALQHSTTPAEAVHL
jgi:hypothetical protein